MIRLRTFLLSIILVAIAFDGWGRAREKSFFDTGAPDRFLELRAYALGGGSTISQNYVSCFNQINELNVAMGTSAGAGVSAQFAIRDFLALGTELNLLVNNYTLDMAVTGEGLSSVSSIFLKNRYATVNIPVFISVRFNLSRGVKWDVDLGTFYSYGLSGRQRQHIYDSRINGIGQLVMLTEDIKAKYYDGNEAFINSFSRGDLGLHIGTGLTFGRHIFMGLRSQIGLKNVAKTGGIVCPNCHNFNILMQAGYRF